MTIIVRLAMSPVTYRSYVSQVKMKILRPEIEEINKKFSKDLIQHHKFDLIDIEKTCEVIDKADVVVHLAAKGNVVESIDNPIEYLNANVISTVNLLEEKSYEDYG